MKKVLSILLSILLISAVFAGCTNQGDKDNAADVSTDTYITVDSHYSFTDESVKRAYEKLCAAVIDGADTVSFNTQMLDDITQLFYTSFPLNSLVSDIHLLQDRTGVSITYKNDIDIHKQKVSEFYNKVNEILDACNLDNAGKDRFVFNVYSYITTNFQIDTTVVSVYDVIMNFKGAAASINSAFEYLVLCGSGEASHVVNTTGAASMISLVKFNSDFYYFDPGSEIISNSGAALKYFAMNDKRVSAYIFGGFNYTDQTEVGTVDNETYDNLAFSVSYKVTDDGISVDYGNNDSFMLEIN